MQNVIQHIQMQVDESIEVKKDFFAKSRENLVAVAKLLGGTLQSGNKIIICGNGGSASDSQHFAGEMVGRFLKERRPLPAVAITTDTATITAIGNDYGYDQVFSRQVEAIGKPGDVLFAISTSGKSPNVLKAAESAKKMGIKIVAMTGGAGGPLGQLADHHLNVALGKNSARIQEVHIMCIHLLVDLVDEFYLSS